MDTLGILANYTRTDARTNNIMKLINCTLGTSPFTNIIDHPVKEQQNHTLVVSTLSAR